MARLLSFVLIFLVGTFLCGTMAFSQTQAKPAFVTLQNREVIEIRWGYKEITPQVRAQAVSGRLKKLATAASPPPAFKVRQSERAIEIVAGNEPIASVFPGDAELAGKSQEDLANEWAAALEQSVRQYRTQHSWQRVTLRIILALLALTACVVLLTRMRRVAPVLPDKVRAWLERRTEERHPLVRQLGRVLIPLVDPFFRALRVLLYLGVLYATLQFLLFLFPATRPWAFPLWHTFTAPLRAFAAKVWRSLPSLVFVLIIAWVTVYLIKFCRFFFRLVREGTITISGFRPAWAGTTQRLTTIAIVTLAVLVAYPYIPGSDSAAFKGISIFLGVLVSLGSTGLVANMISGVMLTYMDAFDMGDLVKIGQTIGYVRKSGLLTTTVETRKHEQITIPNSVVIGSDVTDFSKAAKGVIVSVTAGIGYDTPWRQVEAMMKAAAGKSEGIRSEPEPFVLELSLNTFDITYELNAYLAPGAWYFHAKASLCRNILDQFNEYGVQIMTPAYVMDPAGAKVVPREQWYEAPASDGHPEPGAGDRAA